MEDIMENLKPIKRSPMVIYFGKKYYCIKRYKEWFFSHKKFALKKVENVLKHVVFTHKSLLHRELKVYKLEMSLLQKTKPL